MKIKYKKNIGLFTLVIMALIYIMYIKTKNSFIYNKLQGLHNPECIMTEIIRNKHVYTITNFTEIKGNKICLNFAEYCIDKGDYDMVNRNQNEKYGKLEVISENPDSVFLDDPKKFYSGRYSVSFKVVEGYPAKYVEDTLYTILSNDSSRIVIYKLTKNEKQKNSWNK